MSYNERDELLRVAAGKHGTTVEAILGRSRLRKDSMARRECIAAFRTHGLSTPEIGRLLGRHHTTILELLNGRWDRVPAYQRTEGTA